TTLAVVRPASLDDVVKVVKAANKWPPFAVSARGHGHSINGQADTRMKGVVVEMGEMKGCVPPKVWEKEMYVDVWGGELWIDVLKATM
ncbi:cytokinin dehydrogenase 5, partial [Trifolium medium]|nr:cytokinin dehydrogenase 5 [Trifolium medium]